MLLSGLHVTATSAGLTVVDQHTELESHVYTNLIECTARLEDSAGDDGMGTGSRIGPAAVKDNRQNQKLTAGACLRSKEVPLRSPTGKDRKCATNHPK